MDFQSNTRGKRLHNTVLFTCIMLCGKLRHPVWTALPSNAQTTGPMILLKAPLSPFYSFVMFMKNDKVELMCFFYLLFIVQFNSWFFCCKWIKKTYLFSPRNFSGMCPNILSAHFFYILDIIIISLICLILFYSQLRQIFQCGRKEQI